MPSYCDRPEPIDYLTNFTGQDPVKSVVCGFTQGGDMPLVVFSLFFFGMIGIGLTVRTQHPAPLLVAFMLTASVAALSLPGQAAQILALIVFFGVATLGMYLYSKAQSSL